MTTTAHPVDSTTCPACKAIGAHLAGCSASPCPSWCETSAAEHSLEVDEQLGDGPLHKGPAFGGRLRAWALDDAIGRTVAIDFEDRSDFQTADQLRDLARAAEEAAAWLEANR